MILPPPYSTLLFRRLIFLFFFNDTATTEIYTLSPHDALPISRRCGRSLPRTEVLRMQLMSRVKLDRKSTRLNSSHDQISYAVFCLKKKIYKAEESFREKQTGHLCADTTKSCRQ